MANSDHKPTLSRRSMFAAAGAAGALAATVASLPRTPVAEPQPEAKAAGPEPDKTGYRLTEHIQRYYQTAKV